MITALWCQAHLIPKHGQLLTRLSPRRDVHVFWFLLGFTETIPASFKSYIVHFALLKLQQNKNSVKRRRFDHAPQKHARASTSTTRTNIAMENQKFYRSIIIFITYKIIGIFSSIFHSKVLNH